ncbi:hypothetical protein PPERSA_08238 [Pseudocohnilembus persalinus]|uniref:Uncharacterized protein n=1 Tax=Pseudocohnilembus persalinus TaxID=266149 RepID=A0A0V0QFZ2_PSEPJ|nr:hypothetical protein PPERSA_08238 [Pseudocohnilembus persalinus]|eukprot:KRX01137.1 hypothetical protein PPERSA_08238 [Pseudocohnilembus persalinus]
MSKHNQKKQNPQIDRQMNSQNFQNRDYLYKRGSIKKQTTKEFQESNYDVNLLNLKREDDKKKTLLLDEITEQIQNNENQTKIQKLQKINKLRQSNFLFNEDAYEEDEEDLKASKNLEEMKKRLQNQLKQHKIMEKAQQFMKKKKLIPQSKEQKFNQLIDEFNQNGDDYFLDLQNHLKNLNMINCQGDFKEIERLKENLQTQIEERQQYLSKKQFKLDQDFQREFNPNIELLQISKQMQRGNKQKLQEKKYFERKKNNGLDLMNQLLQIAIENENKEDNARVVQQMDMNDNEDFYQIMNDKIKQKNRSKKGKVNLPKQKGNVLDKIVSSIQNQRQVDENSAKIDHIKSEISTENINNGDTEIKNLNKKDQIEDKKQPSQANLDKLKYQEKKDSIKQRNDRFSENTNFEQFLEENINQTYQKIKKLEQDVSKKYKVFEEYEDKANIFRNSVRELNLGTLDYKYKLHKNQIKQNNITEQKKINKLFQKAEDLKQDFQGSVQMRSTRPNFNYRQNEQLYQTSPNLNSSQNRNWKKRIYVDIENNDDQNFYTNESLFMNSQTNYHKQSKSVHQSQNQKNQKLQPIQSSSSQSSFFYTQQRFQEDYNDQLLQSSGNASAQKFTKFMNDDSNSEIIEQLDEEEDEYQNSQKNDISQMRYKNDSQHSYTHQKINSQSLLDQSKANQKSINNNQSINNVNINSYFNMQNSSKVNDINSGLNKNDKQKGYVTHYNGISSFYASINPTKTNLSSSNSKQTLNQNQNMMKSRKSLNRKSLVFQQANNKRLSIISNNNNNKLCNNTRLSIDQNLTDRSIKQLEIQDTKVQSSKNLNIKNTLSPYQFKQQSLTTHNFKNQNNQINSKQQQNATMGLLQRKNRQDTQQFLSQKQSQLQQNKFHNLDDPNSSAYSIKYSQNYNLKQQGFDKNQQESQQNNIKSTQSLPKLKTSSKIFANNKRKTRQDILDDEIKEQQNQIKSKENRTQLINLMNTIDEQRNFNQFQTQQIKQEQKLMKKNVLEFLKKYDLTENEAEKFKYLMDYKEKERQLLQAQAMMSQQDKKQLQQEANSILKSESLQFEKLKESILSSKSMQMAMRQSIRKKKN